MGFKQIVAGLGIGVMASAVQAGVIYNLSGAGVYSTQVAGATTVNFNDGTCGAYTDCYGNGALLTGSVSGKYASPYGITDRFLSVPYHSSSGSVTLLLDSTYDYFGLYWGSVDTYNHVSFYLGGDLVDTFSGGDLAPLMANGGQGSWTSNRFVNFFFDGGDLFDSIVLTSTSYAFETDNHAFGKVAVPEPGTLALFALGLLGLGLSRRLAD